MGTVDMNEGTEPTPKTAATAGRDQRLLAIIVFSVLFGQVLLYPGLPELVKAFGAETTLNASRWFLTAEFVAFILFATVWGAISDATGRRIPFIVAGAVGGAVGYFFLALRPFGFPSTFSTILVLRGFQGTATIGAFSLALTMLMDLPGGHGRNMGVGGIAIGLGTAVGAPVGGQAASIDPLLPLYLAGSVLLGAALVATRVHEWPVESTGQSVWKELQGLAETPVLAVPYVFGFIDRLSAGFFALVGTLYFRTVFELSAGETGLILALFFAPFALLQYPFGILSDRLGRTVPVVGGSFLYGGAILMVGVAPTVTIAGILMVLIGIVGAFMAPATMALVTDIAPPTKRGVAMGGFNIFGSLGFLVGIVVGGGIAEWYGYLAAFVTVGITEMAIACVLFPVVYRLETDSGSS